MSDKTSEWSASKPQGLSDKYLTNCLMSNLANYPCKDTASQCLIGKYLLYLIKDPWVGQEEEMANSMLIALLKIALVLRL